MLKTIFKITFTFLIINSIFGILIIPILSQTNAPAPEVEKTATASLNIHQWGAVTLFHGLPSEHVRAITQDAEGTIWYGTDAGLAKYDGRRTQKIIAENFSAIRVLALMTDDEGTLWVGSETGAARYSHGVFYPIPETQGYSISAIAFGEGTHAFLGSEQGTIFDCVLDSSGIESVQITGPKNSPLLNSEWKEGTPLPITGLMVSENQLLVSTKGRGLLSKSGDTIKPIFSAKGPLFINTLKRDSAGRLWIGVENGRDKGALYEVSELSNLKISPEITGAITAISSDPYGELWVGTGNRGAYHIKPGGQVEHITFESTSGGLRSNSIYSVFVDREGVVWFGTDRGVSRYDPASPRIEKLSDDPGSNFVRSIAQTSKGLLLCGTNKGLYIRNPRTQNWTMAKEIGARPVYSIAETGPDQILAGTTQGLFSSISAKSDAEPLSFAPMYRLREGVEAGDSIRGICWFQGAVYIASFGRGLEKLDASTRTIIWPIDAPSSREREVVSLYKESEERLWIGTADSSLFIYDGKTIKADPLFGPVTGSAVRSIAGNYDEGLWIATGQGLFFANREKIVLVLGNMETRFVTVSNSPRTAWCATVNNGLYKISIDDSGNIASVRLETENGLPSSSIFTLLMKSLSNGLESLWIGTNRGVAYYQPNRAAPLLKVSRVLGKRAYQPEELASGIRLEYPQNSLLLEVEGISSRTFPEQFQYSFKMINTAGAIVKTKMSRDAQFVMDSLKPGRYSVEATAYSLDLVPSTPLTFQFQVEKAPFPWTSTLLGVLLTMSLFALWWGYHQNRRIASANIALEETNIQLADARLQLANEAENERRRIARDLHDQTLSDMRQLMLLADQLPSPGDAESADQLSPGVFRSEVETISNEIRRICEDLSPSVLTNVGLVAALEWALTDAAAHLPAEKKFLYKFNSGEDLEERLSLTAEEEIQIYRIMQEAIGNICRHADAKKVLLSVDIRNGYDLIITLEDDGCGISEKDRRSGTSRGMSNIRARASMIEAQVGWVAAAQGGTIFTLHKYGRN